MSSLIKVPCIIITRFIIIIITTIEYWLLSCWTRICPAIANSVDPDQLASEEANWSGSALFDIKYVNL